MNPVLLNLTTLPLVVLIVSIVSILNYACRSSDFKSWKFAFVNPKCKHKYLIYILTYLILPLCVGVGVHLIIKEIENPTKLEAPVDDIQENLGPVDTGIIPKIPEVLVDADSSNHVTDQNIMPNTSELPSQLPKPISQEKLFEPNVKPLVKKMESFESPKPVQKLDDEAKRLFLQKKVLEDLNSAIDSAKYTDKVFKSEETQKNKLGLLKKRFFLKRDMRQKEKTLRQNERKMKKDKKKLFKYIERTSSIMTDNIVDYKKVDLTSL